MKQKVTSINIDTRKRASLVVGTLTCDFCDSDSYELFHKTNGAVRICKNCIKEAVKILKGDN